MRIERSFAQRRKSLDSRRGIAATLLAGVLLLGMAREAHAQLFTRGNVLLTSPDSSGETGSATASGDFNGDGFADLAVGAPHTTVAGSPDAGEVLVWYGSASGLGSRVRIRQGLNGLPGTPEELDEFGASLAAGDFDGDGFADLAVGVWFEDVPSGSGPVADAGVVELIYGSSSGLVSAGAQIFNQESPGIGGVLEPDDWFGEALEAGDFNGDGFADLAIGVSSEDVGMAIDAGNLTILFGTAGGLTGIGSETFNEAGAGGTVSAHHLFGFALASGDFDDDAHADLAVGASGEVLNGHANAGAVWIFSGVDGGLSVPGLFLHQGRVLASGTIAGTAEADDEFGHSLAAGDFNRANAQSPRYQDLAIGVAGENGFLGAVEILAGSANGITAAGNFLFFESDLTGTGTSSAFGYTLAAGSLHSGVRADLVVGSPFEDAGAMFSAGRLFVIPGSASGLQLGLADEFDCATPGLACGPPHPYEWLGSALAIGNFDGREVKDLAIGVSGWDSGLGNLDGAVEVLYSALFAADFETHDLSQWSSVTP